MTTSEILFFDQHTDAIPLYGRFKQRTEERCGDFQIKVQKTQITFANRHVFACVSFARVKKKSELPDVYLVVTLGLPYPLGSDRVAVKSEPYPGRWTHHFVVSDEEELDEEFMGWVAQAYEFSNAKR